MLSGARREERGENREPSSRYECMTGCVDEILIEQLFPVVDVLDGLEEKRDDGTRAAGQDRRHPSFQGIPISSLCRPRIERCHRSRTPFRRSRHRLVPPQPWSDYSIKSKFAPKHVRCRRAKTSSKYPVVKEQQIPRRPRRSRREDRSRIAGKIQTDSRVAGKIS